MIGGAQIGGAGSPVPPNFSPGAKAPGIPFLQTDRKSTGASVANSASRFARLPAA